MLMNIDRIATATSFSFAVFEERYSFSYSAILVPSLPDSAWIEGEFNGNAVAANALRSFFMTDLLKGFPLASGGIPVEALVQLDVMLIRFEKQTQGLTAWRETVCHVMNFLRRAKLKYPDNPHYLQTALNAGDLASR